MLQQRRQIFRLFPCLWQSKVSAQALCCSTHVRYRAIGVPSSCLQAGPPPCTSPNDIPRPIGQGEFFRSIGACEKGHVLAKMASERVSERRVGECMSGCPLHPKPHPATATSPDMLLPQLSPCHAVNIVGRKVPASCGTTDRPSERVLPPMVQPLPIQNPNLVENRWYSRSLHQHSLLWLLLLSASIPFSTTTHAVELGSDVGNQRSSRGAPNWAPATNINEITNTRSSASAHTNLFSPFCYAVRPPCSIPQVKGRPMTHIKPIWHWLENQIIPDIHVLLRMHWHLSGLIIIIRRSLGPIHMSKCKLGRRSYRLSQKTSKRIQDYSE